MKLLSAQQLRAADQFTIANERIASLDLMERAARGCVNWLNLNFPELGAVAVFCGTGNNGGDGLAIARLLYKQGKTRFKIDHSSKLTLKLGKWLVRWMPNNILPVNLKIQKES